MMRIPLDGKGRLWLVAVGVHNKGRHDATRDTGDGAAE